MPDEDEGPVPKGTRVTNACTPAMPAPGRGRRRGAGLAWALAATLLAASPARAAETEDQELRTALLAGRTDGEWRGVMAEILRLPPGRVGSILGEVFTSPAYAP